MTGRLLFQFTIQKILSKISTFLTAYVWVLTVHLVTGYSRGETNVVIVPQEVSNSFADSGASLIAESDRVQQVYASSEFVGAKGESLLITGLAFRPDNQASGASLDVVVPAIQFRLGVFNGAMSSIPKNGFADVNAEIVLTEHNLHFTAKPQLTFPVKFSFEKPFLYNRSDGQLVLEIIVNGTVFRSGGFDAQHVSGERGLFIIAGQSVTQSNIIFATQFEYLSVPEPYVVTILSLGISFFLWRCCRA